MDQIKYVIDELNQPPFNQNLNLISYDNLREEQRLDLLIQILNIVDPKLNLPFIRVGNIEDIVATILDTLRIFKYSPPPSHSNPVEFRKNLIMADKDLMTNIFEWLLRRLPLLKKRAYLAHFLVKIELSPDVEGDPDVMTLYRQYLNLIDEFKRIHSSHEMQKKSIDSIIELQKDIKTMELEKDQIKNKLDIVKRRVNLDMIETSNSSQNIKFEAVRAYVMARHENEKLQRQLREQQERITMAKKHLEQQQTELNELNVQDWQESIQSPEVMLYRYKDEIDIKSKLVKDVLPNELTDLRLLVRDMEQIQQHADSNVTDQLQRTVTQVQALTQEINELVEKKLLDKQNEEDRLSHYRQNAQVVARKKEETIKQCEQLERTLSIQQAELEDLRAKFSVDGESALRGDALKLYIEKISRRETEMNEMKDELSRISSDIDELQSKLRSLRQQEKETLEEIHENEETLGLEGYFQMKESTLNTLYEDDNGDGIDDNDQEQLDYEEINRQVDNFQDRLEHVKSSLVNVTKEIRILKEELNEAESEYDMKKRLYDSAAAGLEAELSRSEAEFERLIGERDDLIGEHFEIEARLLAIQIEQTELLGSVDKAGQIIEQLKTEIDSEQKLQENLRQQETEWKEKEQYYKKQMEMWRDLRVIFEIKSRLLTKKLEEKNQQSNSMTMIKDHLVLND
ncbi:Intraflagellar transport protein 81 [Dermatophagoides pteronyssinus]|uniref:Intraflagellar transport protein 81 n=1 Tax=Dermatophagoides pteronyssinus TaxID=6956 RepID=A0ABQ8J859_DERPT|nr:Intraflagellar transport protein 81 [Dermatophagoides pteronyssinus]